MDTMLLHKVLVALLFFWVPTSCFAQVETGAGADKAHLAKSSNTSDNSMVLVHGGTIQVGIDASEIPQFVKIFGIPDPPETLDHCRPLLYRQELGDKQAVQEFYRC